MKKFFNAALLAVLLLTSINTQAQYIPDSNFATQISLACATCIDLNHNLTADAQNQILLEIPQGSGITDLTGLDGFTNLQSFTMYNYGGDSVFLPALPTHLETLELFFLYSSSLPSLPASLRHLACWSTGLTSLPVLPDSLIYFECHNNWWNSLPSLPGSLQVLSCSGMGEYFNTMPDLPPNLIELYCGNFNLYSLPSLPSSLEVLDCSGSGLTTLPSLPSSLTHLYCSSTSVTSLPELPSSLTYLDCSHDYDLEALPPLGDHLIHLDCWYDLWMEHLPALPSSLQYLNARHCHLLDVPVLPDSLTDLDLSENFITSLPNLPSAQMDPDIDFTDNPISCLPFIPDNITGFDISGTNISCLPNIPPGFYSYLPLCEAGNLNGCFAYPTIRGNIYSDFNNNGVFDSSSEYHVSNVIVMANPGNYFGISDSAGNYKIWAPLNSTDTTSVPPLPAYYYPPPTYYTVTFDTTSGQHSLNNDFGILPINIGTNLEATLTAGFFRPGFDCNLWVTITNVGTDDYDGTATITLDPLITFVSADQNGLQSGNTVSWSFNGVHPFQTKTFAATVNTPANLVIGTHLNNSVSGNVTGTTDIDLSNNSQSIISIVNASYDPNDKEASDASINPDQISAGKYLEYTIHFQNTGTAPATFINVADTLSEKLDATTFEMIASSHQYEINFANDLTKANHPVFVKWFFNNIQLPDSSVDFANSQGFVKFRIKPKSDLLIGDEIQNTAGIYFDFNSPVLTNTAVTDVVAVNAVATANNDFFRAIAYPNPASNISTIHFTNVTSSEIQLLITDAIGTTVLQKIIRVPHRSFNINLNLKEFQRGVYFISLKSSDRTYVMKLMKD